MLTLLRMAWRNIGRNRRRTAVLITTVAVGILGTLASISVMWGMIFEMVDTAIETDLGHMQIHAPGYDADPEISLLLPDGAAASLRALEQDPDVRAYARRIRSEALVSSPSTSVGLRLLGVEAEREPRVSATSSWLVEGEFLSGAHREAVIGQRLADRLDVELGDKIVVSAQDTSGDMSSGSLRIRGIFRSPSTAFDEAYLFVNLEDSARLLGTGNGVTEVIVVANDRESVRELQTRIIDRVPDREIRRWDEIQPFIALIVESTGATAASFYAVIFVAMAFGIANVMLMSIFDRVREIGVMLALGMSRFRLVALVMFEGILVTTLGTLIGLGLAGGLVWTLSGGIDFSWYAAGLNEFGVGSRITPILRPIDFVEPIVIAIFTALIASLWPALRAIRLQPAEATRHT
ncbi:MAG: FtsX-like permease family protein [Myxococcota bacterium]